VSISFDVDFLNLFFYEGIPELNRLRRGFKANPTSTGALKLFGKIRASSFDENNTQCNLIGLTKKAVKGNDLGESQVILKIQRFR
jgi:hypothetical protein